MKLLIIGRTGQLGSALVKDCEKLNYEIIAPSKKELNILYHHKFSEILNKNKPDIVINTAAFHNVPVCEVEPLKAFETNCIAVKNMAEICNDLNIEFITFSTDYVFNGKKNEQYIESDIPNPLNMYGISKLAGEYASLIYENTIIIRTCGLYGLEGAFSKGGNFVDKRIEESRFLKKTEKSKNLKNSKNLENSKNPKDSKNPKKNFIEISSDQIVSPTFTCDLSKAIIQLIEHPLRKSKIYHLVNEGYCTWYEFTKEIFDILKIKTKVVPINREGKYDGIRKPLFSALYNQEAKKLGITLPHWKDALRRYLELKYLSNFYK